MLERFADEIDGMFDEFGLGRGRTANRAARSQPWASTREAWVPEVEVYQQSNELVVRADLPGLQREDITVNVREHDLTITGERRQEQATERSGLYHSELSYGSFARTIPLPDGAMADQATATFRNGVLEVRLPAPPEHMTRGRRLEIKEKK